MSIKDTQANSTNYGNTYRFIPDENRHESLLMRSWLIHGETNRLSWGDFQATDDSSISENNSIQAEEIGPVAERSQTATTVEESSAYMVKIDPYTQSLARLFGIVDNKANENKPHFDSEEQILEKHPPYKAVGSNIPWGQKVSYADYVKQQQQQQKRSSARRNYLDMEEDLEKELKMQEVEQLLSEAVSYRCDSPLETVFDCGICDKSH